MQAYDMTDHHRAALARDTARARAEVEASTADALYNATVPPKPGVNMRRYRAAGYWAMLFCLWFAFLTPLILVLTYWD